MAFKRALYNEKIAYPDDYITVLSADGEKTMYIRIAATNINDIKLRIKEADKAYAHGSYVYGDGKIESRKLKLSCHVRAATQCEHDEKCNELLRLLMQRDYILRLARSDREYHVSGVMDVKQKWIKGFQWLWSDIDITLMLADPFVYATGETVITQEFDTPQINTVMQVLNDSPVDVPLTFNFSPKKGIAMDQIKFVHVESGEQMQLSDALLVHPKIARVDGVRGTVRRDNDNNINTFKGVFLHALPGKNTFKYTGSAGTVEIIFKQRWYI